MGGILTQLSEVASRVPLDQVALSGSGGRYTYPQLLQKVGQLCAELEKLSCEVLALHADNSVGWVLADLACQQAGIVTIPLPTFFSSEQLANCTLATGARFVLSDHEHRDAVFPGIALGDPRPLAGLPGFYLRPVQAPQAAQMPAATQKVTFTSGSTGAPKGVCLSLDHQWRVARSLADTIGEARPRHLCLLPLSTLLENIAGVMTPLLLGGEVVVLDDRERGFHGSSSLDVERLLQCIEETRPNTLILIPQLLNILLAALRKGWEAPDSLSFIAVGGGKVAGATLAAAQDLGLPVYQGYGLSECASVVALNSPRQHLLSSVGRPLPHCSVAIEDGEIVVSGATFLGYLGDPESWYPDKVRTGDIGRLDAGWLTVEGRKKNLLITSFGRNISPEWIEASLLSASLLSHCVVMGDGDASLSALVAAPGGVSDEAIDRWVDQVNEKLPDYARVVTWTRVGEAGFRAYCTENGRPKRELIKQDFSRMLAVIGVSARAWQPGPSSEVKI